MKIIFDELSKDWILNLLNLSVDKDNFVINQEKQRILSTYNKEFKFEDLRSIHLNTFITK